jgi:hypothetical protein
MRLLHSESVVSTPALVAEEWMAPGRRSTSAAGFTRDVRNRIFWAEASAYTDGPDAARIERD